MESNPELVSGGRSLCAESSIGWRRLTSVFRRSERSSARPATEENKNSKAVKKEKGNRKNLKEEKAETKKEDIYKFVAQNPWHPPKRSRIWKILNCCGSREPKTLKLFGPYKDGGFYGSLADAEEERMKARLEMAKKRINELTDGIEEKEKNRVAIGKADLLIKKTFHQFRGLCTENLEQRAGAPITDSGPTLDEDLESFWKLIMVQVEVIHKIFDEVSHNNVETITKPKPKCGSGDASEMQAPCQEVLSSTVGKSQSQVENPLAKQSDFLERAFDPEKEYSASLKILELDDWAERHRLGLKWENPKKIVVRYTVIGGIIVKLKAYPEWTPVPWMDGVLDRLTGFGNSAGGDEEKKEDIAMELDDLEMASPSEVEQDAALQVSTHEKCSLEEKNEKCEEVVVGEDENAMLGEESVEEFGEESLEEVQLQSTVENERVELSEVIHSVSEGINQLRAKIQIVINMLEELQNDICRLIERMQSEV